MSPFAHLRAASQEEMNVTFSGLKLDKIREVS